MKISKLFHWLYFTVMMLPVFLIPIFAIYTRNENYSSNMSVTVDKTVTTYDVDYTYMYQTNDVNTINDLVLNNVYHCDFVIFNGYYNDDGYVINLNNNTTFNIRIVSFVSNGDGMIDYNDITGTVFGSSYNSSIGNYIDIDIYGAYHNFRYSITNSNVNTTWVYSFSDTYIEYTDFDFYIVSGLDSFKTFVTNNNLDISSSDFNILTGAEIVETTTGSTVTYNDTDIASQFVYTIYNTVDKYFNFDSVFNFGDLYTWLNTNFFNGNAPLGFFIFWHYLIYWLLVSLLWLIFDVLIYVPQLVHRWLDKASLS